MIIGIVLKKPIMNPKMLGKALFRKRVKGGQCRNCDIPHPGVCPCAW